MEHSENIGPSMRSDWAISAPGTSSPHDASSAGHETDFTGDFIAWERPPHTDPTELQPKLRCTQCGNRTVARFHSAPASGRSREALRAFAALRWWRLRRPSQSTTIAPVTRQTKPM